MTVSDPHAGLPGYGYLPTMALPATGHTDRLINNLSAAAASAAAYYPADYQTAATAAIPGALARQLAAATGAAVATVPRSDPSPLPLSSSPLSQRPQAGTAGIRLGRYF